MRLTTYIFCLFILFGCENSQAINDSYIPPDTPGGHLCINQCGLARNYCLKSCDLNQHACFEEKQSQSLEEYDQYMSKQYSQQQPIAHILHDFEDTSPCEHIQKNCMNECKEHYQSCYKDCGGSILTTPSCGFLCF